MRKALRYFLNWLDTRFPQKVVLTEVEFLSLRTKLEAIEKIVTVERLKMIESEINKFNVHMGFGGAIPTSLKAFQR